MSISPTSPTAPARAAAALAALSAWERNFLRLLATGGPNIVLIQFGSTRGRTDREREYGVLRSVADVEAVAEQIRRRAEEAVAELVEGAA